MANATAAVVIAVDNDAAAENQVEGHLVNREHGRPITLKPQIPQEAMDLTSGDQVVIHPARLEVRCQVPTG